MKLIDTNIIMYAVGKTHTLKEPCKEVIHKVVNNEISANIDIEVLQELLYVYDSRGEGKRGLRIIGEMMVLFPNPFAISKNEIIKAKDLMTKYSTITTRDAIHCAVTINLNLEGIISTDKGLGVVKDIHLLNP